MSKKKVKLTRKNGKFIKGNKEGHGRPRGSKNHNGLNACLDILQKVVSKEKNLKKLEEAFQKAIDHSTLGFYYKFVMPLLPKDIDIGFKEDTLAALISQWEKNNGNK